MKTAPAACALLCVAAVLAACKGPIDRSDQEALRERLITRYRTRAAQSANGGIVELAREPSDVERQLTDERRQELDAMSGGRAYSDDPLKLGADLEGNTEADLVNITLDEAIRKTIESNLDLRIARISPAVRAEQLIQAQAAFDAVFFTTASWAKLDTPQPPGPIPGLAGDTQSEAFELTTGIIQPLRSGGSIGISNTIAREERVPSVLAAPEFYDNDVAITASHSLLRGFGADVNTAQIDLAQNARQRDIEALHSALLDAAQAAEAGYWRLVFSRQQLRIQTRLLERTMADRDRLELRKEFDAAPVQITEANSFVELRRGDVIRARQAVRQASDDLKKLINSPALPVSSETLLVPTEAPGDLPIEMSLLDSVTTALRRRPSLQAALLTINDASIRQRVADNARLPILDLEASVVYNGLDVDRADEAFANSFDGDYIDYLLGATFEQPIGNRGPRAGASAARLQRQQSVLAYQSLAQDVVLEVKGAMRTVRTTYELIGSTRAARRAAADNLRAIEAQEKEGFALTPDFINRKLQSQERLANAEIQEIAALVDYRNALAAYYRSIGSLLERNGVVFERP